jgi:hypothetical protein
MTVDPVQLLEAKKGAKTLKWLADDIGSISVTYLSYVLRRMRPPGPRVLRYLGLEKIQQPPLYRKRRK